MERIHYILATLPRIFLDAGVLALFGIVGLALGGIVGAGVAVMLAVILHG